MGDEIIDWSHFDLGFKIGTFDLWIDSMFDKYEVH